MQCLQATVPLVDYFITGNTDPKEYFESELALVFTEFFKIYQTSKGIVDPTKFFEAVTNKKRCFRDHSQFDSYDILLTILGSIINDQKKIFQKKNNIEGGLEKISNSKVTLGVMFGFTLINKGMQFC